MKSTLIIFLLLLWTCHSNNDNHDVEVEVVDVMNDSISCPETDSNWNYSQMESFLTPQYQDHFTWIENIYIDDYEGKMRINIDVSYRFDHYEWDSKILAVDIMKYLFELEKVCSTPIPDRSKCYVSVNYDIKTGISSALSQLKIPLSQFANYNKPLYPRFVNYILVNMTPSDFQAYDHALKNLYSETKSQVFNKSFYAIVLDLSSDEMLSADEEIVLSALTNWAVNKSETETTKHFNYFAEQCSKK
jgi:hypothetical protein